MRTQKLEELDLAIMNMDTEEAEKQFSEIIHGVAGVEFVRIIERGAFIRYDANTITNDESCALFHRPGLRAGVLQDTQLDRAPP